MSNNKAVPYSVSFRPSSLYEWAVSYGKSQQPEMSASAVVCLALSEYKTRVEPGESLNAELAAAIDEIGADKALDVLNRSKRRRKAA